ncbi:pro-apoptotic WT1 regulator [Turdus rufiventris]|nr:pro-apoptotic WT1 regulator [Turdus rufiventris]
MVKLRKPIKKTDDAGDSLDEYEDDEAGQKERKKEDAITQQNTIQNESSSADTSCSYLLQCDVIQHHFTITLIIQRVLQDGFKQELAKERQENARLIKMAQDKEELIGKLKEEIDLLNRDLDDIEDENEQLKQENKTLLKVVGQLTSFEKPDLVKGILLQGKEGKN